MDVEKQRKYSLSFTSIGIRRLETVEVVRAYRRQPDWSEIRRAIVRDNIISLNSENTRKRVGIEIIKRLRNLEDKELAFLAEAVDDDQLAMLWVAVCRTYPVLRSFSQDVVAARFANNAPDVPRTAWSAFIQEEALEHPKLAKLTEKSQHQLEIRAFGMLRECHLLDRDSNITPLYPSERFLLLLRERAPEDLSVFPKAGVVL